MTKEYKAALEASRQASREFAVAQTAYRARQISTDEFLTAKAKHDAACKAFDVAYAKEQERDDLEEGNSSIRRIANI